jgi:hypothetical protein
MGWPGARAWPGLSALVLIRGGFSGDGRPPDLGFRGYTVHTVSFYLPWEGNYNFLEMESGIGLNSWHTCKGRSSYEN